MPTLGDYMRWLRDNGGECRSGIGADEEVGMVPVTKLIASDGRSVIHYGNDQGEVLSESMVDYFDRRLGVISPFRSIPRA